MVKKAERFKAARNIKIATPMHLLKKLRKCGKLDLPKKPIFISDTETDQNKALEQHLVKVLPNDELHLIKNNQMLTDTSINLVQDILGTQFKIKDRFKDGILGQKLRFQPNSPGNIEGSHRNLTNQS